MIAGLALEKIIWPLVGFVAACAVVIGLWEATPVIGPRARVAHQVAEVQKWRKGYDTWHAYGLAERKAFQESERRRGLEGRQAVASLEAANLRCEARVKEARRSAARIRDLVNQEPKPDANGCPSRQLIPSDRLRDALQPARGR